MQLLSGQTKLYKRTRDRRDRETPPGGVARGGKEGEGVPHHKKKTFTREQNQTVGGKVGQKESRNEERKLQPKGLDRLPNKDSDVLNTSREASKGKGKTPPPQRKEVGKIAKGENLHKVFQDKRQINLFEGDRGKTGLERSSSSAHTRLTVHRAPSFGVGKGKEPKILTKIGKTSKRDTSGQKGTEGPRRKHIRKGPRN